MNRGPQQGDSMKTVIRLVMGTIGAGICLILTVPLYGGDDKTSIEDLGTRLRVWDATVLRADNPQSGRLPQMLADDARARLRAANLRESQAWQVVKTRADWEKFRDIRLQALRVSLGPLP